MLDRHVQTFGASLGLNTACFRLGSVSGPPRQAAASSGLLGGIVDRAMLRQPYVVRGHKGKQLRDVIHVQDVVHAFAAYVRRPRPGSVYNLGGGRHAHLSLREAVSLAEAITGHRLAIDYQDRTDAGSPAWWVSSCAAFRADYPAWQPTYDVVSMMDEWYDVRRSSPSTHS